jgi:hypothetical protein
VQKKNPERDPPNTTQEYYVVQHRGISLVGVPKKVVSLSKSAHVSVSSEFILQIKLILSSPNVVLTFYTYKVSNKKVSS